MSAKFNFLFLVVVCFAGFVSAKPQLVEVGDCGENEQFTLCLLGCPPRCGDTTSPILCVQPCVVGCQCRSGFVLNSQGRCVRPENC